jgi:hypothetical protein
VKGCGLPITKAHSSSAVYMQEWVNEIHFRCLNRNGPTERRDEGLMGEERVSEEASARAGVSGLAGASACAGVYAPGCVPVLTA